MNKKWYFNAALMGIGLLFFSVAVRADNPFDYTWYDIEVTEGSGVRYSGVSPSPIDPWFAQYDYTWNLLQLEAHWVTWWDLTSFVPVEDRSGGGTIYDIPPVDMVNEHFEAEQYIGFPFYATLGAQADVHAWVDADGYGHVEVSNVQMDVADKVRIDLSLHVEASRLLGDANLDDYVDDADFGVLAANWQDTGATWAQGDYNYDGSVDDADFGVLAAHWNWTNAGAPTSAGDPVNIPEPATMSLLGVGALALLRRRK